jgi:hypothetical protein
MKDAPNINQKLTGIGAVRRTRTTLSRHVGKVPPPGCGRACVIASGRGTAQVDLCANVFNTRVSLAPEIWTHRSAITVESPIRAGKPSESGGP